MSDTLTQLTAKIQAILGDNGTIFTSATCTAAVRQALAEFNRRAPGHAAGLIPGVNGQYEYELSDYDSAALHIIDVLRQGDGASELDVSITYDEYIEDERVFFRLRQPVTSSDTLIVRYTRPHTISGLDGATESTLLSEHDQIIVDGAAYHAVLIRATSRVESINLSKDQSDNYREVAAHFRTSFDLGLAHAGRRHVPVGEPDTRAWNDLYHGWDQ